MDKRVMVFGSYVTDLSARTEAFPQAGQTVRGNSFAMGPGGKGSNQAVAAKRAGADVWFVTKIGADALGRQALQFYEAEGMSEHVLVDETQQTGVALIMVDEHSAQNRIIVVSGASGGFTDADMPSTWKGLEQCDMLLLQLETNIEPVYELVRKAKAGGKLVLLNPAPARQLEEEILRCVDIITPNETEAKQLTGVAVVDEESARIAAQKLHASGVEKVIITLGSKGCYASDGKTGKMVPSVAAR